MIRSWQTALVVLAMFFSAATGAANSTTTPRELTDLEWQTICREIDHRAYAANAAGTAYGKTVDFTTPEGSSNNDRDAADDTDESESSSGDDGGGGGCFISGVFD
jgi:hypothetical protein